MVSGLVLMSGCVSLGAGPPEKPPAPTGAVTAVAPVLPTPPETTPGMTPRELFEVHCGACHALELPTSQRLDRATWVWVFDDMAEEYGMTWLTDEEREVILDYVTAEYGPGRRTP